MTIRRITRKRPAITPIPKVATPAPTEKVTKLAIPADAISAKPVASRKRQRGHVIAKAPLIDLNGPGRLRSAHVLALCGFSHSTLYLRLKNQSFPKPDGKDGGLNYWNTRTIREYLDAPGIY